MSYLPKLKIYTASNDSEKLLTDRRQMCVDVSTGTLASGGNVRPPIEWVYSSGKVLFRRENATIAISTDGQAWTETTIGAPDTGTTSAFVGFAFSQSLSRLVAMTQDGGIAYSDDFRASGFCLKFIRIQLRSLRLFTVNMILFTLMTSRQGNTAAPTG